GINERHERTWGCGFVFHLPGLSPHPLSLRLGENRSVYVVYRWSLWAPRPEISMVALENFFLNCSLLKMGSSLFTFIGVPYNTLFFAIPVALLFRFALVVFLFALGQRDFDFDQMIFPVHRCADAGVSLLLRCLD